MMQVSTFVSTEVTLLEGQECECRMKLPSGLCRRPAAPQVLWWQYLEDSSTRGYIPILVLPVSPRDDHKYLLPTPD